jgi:hypothetical protein
LPAIAGAVEPGVTLGQVGVVAARTRWVRLLYQGRTQVRLVAQGASAHVFGYWEPMFFEAMRTVHFGDQI